MHFKLLGLSLVTGMMSATAFAEPAIQPGDTLESLSQVKVNTTVNGQAGSIQDLVASGQIRIVDAGQVAAEPNPAGAETELQSNAAADTTAAQAAPQTAELNTTAQNAEATQAASETEAQTTSASDATAAQGTEMNTAAQAVDPTIEQANAPATEQTAQAAPENVDPMQPNTELAAQQAEQGAGQEIAAAPVSESPADARQVNAANMPQADVTNQSAALVPADTTEANAPQEAFAATPEATQPTDAVQAAPETDATDAPVNASPEAPVTEATEN
ncbi:hypothetical protein [Acinetobacter sp. ANC 4169]|jgi:hypothetical protein|uniref:hypothetical protein n=1 Tax=Acinetobacter sp. ANC 4169 TaxID=1977879 RepID=UPI001D0D39DC|nr:hypothetical protein [Acinetobacter sp. ANC 4169]